MKRGECGKTFPKKDDQLTELVPMNLRTPYDVFCSSFHTNRISHKEDGKDYTFDVFCDLLIKDQQKLFDEGNLGGKHKDHLLKIKGKSNYKERGHTNASGSKYECFDQKTKLVTKESSTYWKNRKKKTCQYCGKVGHNEKTCWKKTYD